MNHAYGAPALSALQKFKIKKHHQGHKIINTRYANLHYDLMFSTARKTATMFPCNGYRKTEQSN